VSDMNLEQKIKERVVDFDVLLLRAKKKATDIWNSTPHNDPHNRFNNIFAREAARLALAEAVERADQAAMDAMHGWEPEDIQAVRDAIRKVSP